MDWNESVINCNSEFKFRCPKKWDDLVQTAEDSVRFCMECQENVYLVQTDTETLQRARAGQCVARRRPEDTEEDALLGEIGPEYEARLAAEDEKAQREKRIEEALRRLPGNAKPCPKCGYPEDGARGCTVCV